MRQITLRVLPKNFAVGPPFTVTNNWQPHAVVVHHKTPPTANVIAAPLPTRGGMRIVVYNRESFPVEVVIDAEG